MKNQTLAEKLRVILEIVEKELPSDKWEVRDLEEWRKPTRHAVWYVDAIPFEVRIKPTPKRVPLSAEDVPPGSVFRNPAGRAAWFTPLAIRPHQGILYFVKGDDESPSWMNWPELDSRDFEIKRPGQDWQPCWKEQAE